MNLILDLGNTNFKTAVFNSGKMIYSQIQPNSEGFGIQTIKTVKQKFPAIQNIILSSVVEYPSVVENYARENFNNFLALDVNTPLPLINTYKSDTLGKDRLAAAVGAYNKFPDTNVLVIDIGTAITFDVVDSKGYYLGGNISPGINIRYKALNNFTGKLPLLEKTTLENNHYLGKTTNEAIMYGVQQGILYEIESYITNFAHIFADLKVILTGGDIFFFEKNLKNTIFADQNLVLYGLNQILLYNVK